jgi:hypothetical protein
VQVLVVGAVHTLVFVAVRVAVLALAFAVTLALWILVAIAYILDITVTIVWAARTVTIPAVTTLVKSLATIAVFACRVFASRTTRGCG